MASINPFLLLTLGVAASMLVIPLLSRLAPRLGLLDLPDPRKVHALPVPRVGGWGITIGAILPLVLLLPLDPILTSYVVGVGLVFLFGVWDDARELTHWPKFVGQLLAVGGVVFYADLYVTRIPFVDIELGTGVGRLFTIFVFVGVINAINHSDGLDGLAGGESLLTLIALAVLGYVVGDSLTASVAMAMIGGILGFLRYNSHPARVFMGDSGSQVLGFTLGFLAIYVTQVAHTAVSAALPLLLVGLPVADILAVLYQRIRSGGNWFLATRNHIHHRLLNLGLSHHETVIIIYSVHAMFVVSAVLLRYASDWAIALLYAAVVGALFVGLAVAEALGWRVRRTDAPVSSVDAAIDRLAAGPLLRLVPLGVISALVPGIMLFGAVWVARVPRDFALAALVLAAVVAAEMLRPRALRSFVSRMAVYAAAIFSTYLLIIYPRTADNHVQTLTLVLMVALAGAIATYVRFTAKQAFGTTPTDYLVVFGLVALLAFGAVDAHSRAIVEMVAYATVLLYGCEVVLGLERRWPVLHVSTLATLAILAFRGVA